MSDVKQIDERIRERARQELFDEVTHVAEKLRNYLRIGHSLSLYPNDKPSAEAMAKLTCSEALTTIRDRIVDHYSERREQAAVDDFVKKVDSLQEQISELQESVAGNS